MRTTRRDFLKGLMALTGAAVIGLPDFERVEVEPEVADEFPRSLIKPVGDWGSIRIDGNWHALHSAVIEKSTFGIAGLPLREEQTVTCALEDVEGINFYDPSVRDVEIDVIGRIFRGQMMIGEYGVSWEPDRRHPVEYNLALHVVGPLERMR
jgi:hypothetical protein